MNLLTVVETKLLIKKIEQICIYLTSNPIIMLNLLF